MITALSMAEELLGNNLLKRLAKSVLKAQDYREQSWDGYRYILSQREAAVKACMHEDMPSNWAPRIDHWNHYMWNDVQAWAKEILKNFDAKEMETKFNNIEEEYDDGDQPVF